MASSRAALAIALLVVAAFAQCVQCVGFPKGDCAANVKGGAPKITRIGSWWTGNYGGGGVEILAYMHTQGQAVVAVVESSQNNSGIAFLNLADPTKPTLTRRFAYDGEDSTVGTPNSVMFYKTVLAVATDGVPREGPGYVRFHNGLTGDLISQVGTCAQPDMLTWNKDGSKIYVACEGEPFTQANEDNFSDPLDGQNEPGAIGVLDVKWKSDGSFVATSSKNISIQKYIDRLSNRQFKALQDQGLLIDGRLTKAQAAMDIEPEYLALDEDGHMLYASLQENNAILVVDLKREEVVNIWPLGFKDWSKHSADLSDRDGGANMRKWPKGVRGLYQPDTIIFKKVNGKGYLFIANEGDGKEEKQRAGDLSSVELRGANWTALKSNELLGRINVSPWCGLKNGYDRTKAVDEQGPYTALCTYGGRSFSILSTSTGKMVYDSGSEFEQVTLQQAGDCFNCDRDANSADVRSDDAGVEPEAMEVLTFNGRTYAFIGLERQAGIMIYDVTTPSKAKFVQYWNNRDRTAGYELPDQLAIMGDLAPEMIKWIPADKSHTGSGLLLVTNEYSASVTVHTVTTCPPKPTRKLK